jgi:hypothetical protein
MVSGAKMAVPFHTGQWIRAFMEEINQSAASLVAAKNWEGDSFFIVDPGARVWGH